MPCERIPKETSASISVVNELKARAVRYREQARNIVSPASKAVLLLMAEAYEQEADDRSLALTSFEP